LSLQRHVHHDQATPQGSRALADVLSRPDSERLREYRYRFGQGFVFGLPVLFLCFFGDDLGGATAGPWSGLLQALLAGWLIYVCAAGMLFEGVLLLVRRQLTAELLVGAAAALLYLLGLWSWGRLLAGGPSASAGGWFAACVLVLNAWVGAGWWRLARRQAPGAG
jgi:hypothetical protein